MYMHAQMNTDNASPCESAMPINPTICTFAIAPIPKKHNANVPMNSATIAGASGFMQGTPEGGRECCRPALENQTSVKRLAHAAA